jgi:hypothetical protein
LGKYKTHNGSGGRVVGKAFIGSTLNPMAKAVAILRNGHGSNV